MGSRSSSTPRSRGSWAGRSAKGDADGAGLAAENRRLREEVGALRMTQEVLREQLRSAIARELARAVLPADVEVIREALQALAEAGQELLAKKALHALAHLLRLGRADAGGRDAVSAGELH